MKNNGDAKWFSKTARSVEKRKSALKRLENNLLTGHKKIVKDGEMSALPLSEGDIKRIKSEINKLKERI